MDVRKTALLAGALVVAIITALLARSMFANAAAPAAAASSSAAPAKASGPKILVATRALPVGTIISADSFRLQPWPDDLIENAYFKDGPDFDANHLIGQVVRTALAAGQPISQGALVKPGDRGFLAAALGPGMRAITVAVSAESGVAGFVFPGDRVDMVLTQSIEQGEATLRTSETIIRNLRVLATDQRTNATDADGRQDAQVSQTVTLEVTPRLAEKIAVAQAIGKLSLVLRALSDTASDLERAIAAGRVKLPANADPAAERRMINDVASRPNDNDPSFVTAADVSRFQRTSLTPAMGGSAARLRTAETATPRPASAPMQAPAVRVWRSTSPDAGSN